jgi:trimeric autotransporter adhesin
MQIRDYDAKTSVADSDLLLIQDTADDGYKKCTKAELFAGFSSGGSRGYYNQVIADYPDYYFRLGETSGSTALDSSGFNRNGVHSNTVLNSASLLVGDSNKATYFNGANSQIVFSNIYTSSGGVFSLDLLVNLSSTNLKGTFVKIGGSSNGFGIGVGGSSLDNNGNNLIGLAENVTFINTGKAIGTGTHHIGLSFNANACKFYLDGKLVYSITQTTITPDNNAGIGGYGSGRAFTGVIDEVAIYGCELPANRFYAHYKASLLAA